MSEEPFRLVVLHDAENSGRPYAFAANDLVDIRFERDKPVLSLRARPGTLVAYAVVRPIESFDEIVAAFQAAGVTVGRSGHTQGDPPGRSL